MTNDLILPRELTVRVDSWHSGMWSACYSLASTAAENLVSKEMIEAAADELESMSGKHDTAELKLDRETLADALRTVVIFADEHRWEGE